MTAKRWSISFAPEDEAGLYQVTVRRSGSVHRFKTRLPPDIADLWQEGPEGAPVRSFRSADAEALTPQNRFFQAADLPTLKDIGERVLEAIFDTARPGEGPKIVGALEDRIADNDGVELQIDLSQAPELSGVPWESLYLRSRDRFLAIATTSNIVRKLDTQNELPPPVEKPVRILVAAANPWRDLETGAELGNIQQRIERLVTAGQTGFEIEALPNVRRDELRRKINDWKPHVIHYIGHSDFDGDEGYLALETEEADVGEKLTAEALRNMLLNQRPWLVVLNSCRSAQTSADAPMAGVAQNLLQRINVPFVIGMQQPVSDTAAITFSQEFYGALLAGEPIASAVSIGRAAIASDYSKKTQVELITPALYTSGETDRIAFVDGPDGPAAAAAAAASATGVAGGVEEAAIEAGAKAGDAQQAGWLDQIDRRTKIFASIVTSLTVIAGGAVAIFQTLDRDPVEPAAAPPAAIEAGRETPSAQATSPAADQAPLAQSDEAVANDSDRPAAIAATSPGGNPVQVVQSPTLPPRAAAAVPPSPAPPAPAPAPVLPVRGPVPMPGSRPSPPGAGENLPPAPPPPAIVLPPPPPSVQAGVELGEAATLEMPPPVQSVRTVRSFRPPSLPTGSEDQNGENAGRAAFRFANVAEQAPRLEQGGTPGRAEAMGQPERRLDAYRYDELDGAGGPTVSEAGFAPAFCDGLALTVNFGFGSAVPSAADTQRLSELGDSLACPRSGLVVAGFTDASGDAESNADLSLDRARAVADIVIDRPNGKNILTADLLGYGANYPVSDPAQDVAASADRRVEVYLDVRCPWPPYDYVAASVQPGLWDDAALRDALRARGDGAGTSTAPRSALIFYYARDAAQFEGTGADAELRALAEIVAGETGLPLTTIFPMKLGASCLVEGEDTRIDIVLTSVE